MSQRIFVFAVLFTFTACGHAPASVRPGKQQPSGYRYVFRAEFDSPADFYVVRFRDGSAERVLLAYILDSRPGASGLFCNQETRTCRGFIRPELTLFAVPIMDPHLRQGTGVDICPVLEIIRNAVLMRTFIEREHERFCAYRIQAPSSETVLIGQRLGRR